MNTKFFLLLIVFLGISITTSSVATNKKEEIHTEASYSLPTGQSTQNDSKEDVPAPDQMPKVLGSHERVHRPNSEEDGKHHHFHFSRIGDDRKRWLLVLGSKIVLTIIHVCSFIYCYLHVFH